MPFFIECSVPYIVYRRGEKVINNPINLDLCKSIKKSTLAWYPDNTGKPEITFDGCDATWAFDTETSRDAEFDRIASLQTTRLVNEN